MKLKNFLYIAFALLFVLLTAYSYPVTTMADEYDFSERILYGGLALDVDDYIYYANPQDNDYLYRRVVGQTTGQLIYPSPVSYLNYSDGFVYFVSGDDIIRITPEGKDSTILYSDNNSLSQLYVAQDTLYFMRDSSIIKFDGEVSTTLLYREGLQGFRPLGENKFLLYSDNPDFIAIDQKGSEIYTETAERYLSDIFDLKTSDIVEYIPIQETATFSTAPYEGPYITVGETTLPLQEYPPGSFFSKNGKACTCHNIPIPRYCIDSLGDCNCMRYWPTGIQETCEVDLLGAQCFAFARLVFYKCFGFLDHSYINPTKFYSAGSLPAGGVTESTVKELFSKADTGAHVRLSRGHSVSIFSMTEEALYIYHGNAGGDNVLSQPCVVSTKRYSWKEFAAYAASGIEYVNMPYDYPGYEVTPRVLLPGHYDITVAPSSNLNIRSGPSVSSPVIGSLYRGDKIEVNHIEDTWGRLANRETEGWISLDYASFVSKTVLEPTQDNQYGITVDRDLLVGISEHFTLAELLDLFPNTIVSAVDIKGRPLSDVDYIGSGTEVFIMLDNIKYDQKRVFLSGDCDGNGIINVVDYLLVQRVFYNSANYSDFVVSCADINIDGTVDSKDILLIKRYLLGLDALYS